MSVILTLNGPYFGQYHRISGDIGPISGDIGPISGNMGPYRTISDNNRVISSSVKSVMYWARQIKVVPG